MAGNRDSDAGFLRYALGSLRAALVCVGLGLALLFAGCGNTPRFDWRETARNDPNWAFAAEVSPSGKRIFVAPQSMVRNRTESLGSFLNPHTDLQAAFDAAQSGDAVLIASGDYAASPSRAIDPLGGNLSDAECVVNIPVTVGFRIRNSISVIGAGHGKTILRTNAGYGVLIENTYDPKDFSARLTADQRHDATRLPRRQINLPNIRTVSPVVIRGLTVTGGIRDLDGRATSAAIVVRNAHVQVADCDIIDNRAEPAELVNKYPGIAGICAREGSHVAVANCYIANNSWDGIVAYRSHPDFRIPATIGVTKTTIRYGEGVGIGATWDSRARIREVEVRGYWKGIGAFGTSEVVVEDSIVIAQRGWGVVATGDCRMAVVGCVVEDSGTTGAARWSPAADFMLMNSIVSNSGRAPQEWVGKRVGLWLNPGVLPPNVRHNTFWNNLRTEVGHGGVLGSEDDPVTPLFFEGQHENRNVAPKYLADGSYRAAADSPLAGAGDPFTDQRLAAWLANTSFTVPAVEPGRRGEASVRPGVRDIGISRDAAPGCVR